MISMKNIGFLFFSEITKSTPTHPYLIVAVAAVAAVVIVVALASGVALFFLELFC